MELFNEIILFLTKNPLILGIIALIIGWNILRGAVKIAVYVAVAYLILQIIPQFL